eukprot:8942075-Karenia_brevis.AAC.1
MLKTLLGISRQNANDLTSHPLFVGARSYSLSIACHQNSSHGYPHAAVVWVDTNNHPGAHPTFNISLDNVAPHVHDVALGNKLFSWRPRTS